MFEMPFSLLWLAPELRLGTASLPLQPVQDGGPLYLLAYILKAVSQRTQAKTSPRVRPGVSVEVPTKM